MSLRSFRFTSPALMMGLGLSLFAQTGAHATALTAPVPPTPFADTALSGTTAAARPELAGTVLEDWISSFSFNGVTGTIQNRVVRETGTGTLDFYWKVDVDSSDTGAGVTAFRLTDFGYGNLKDADWRIDGLGTVAPTTGRLFNAVNQPDGSINFLFDGAVTAGTQSRFFFLHTDATRYAKTAGFDLLSSGSNNISPTYGTFAPAVPEPSTWALAIVGLAVAGAARQRRQG